MPRVPVVAARSLSGVAELSEAGHQGRPGWAALDWAVLIKLLTDVTQLFEFRPL